LEASILCKSVAVSSYGLATASDFFWTAPDDFVAGSSLVGFEVFEEKISELACAGIESGFVCPAVAGNENV
jgi:hypothetical protein